MSLGVLRHGWPTLTIQAITQAESVDVIVPSAEEVCDLSVSEVKEAILSERSDVFQDEQLEPMAGPALYIELDRTAAPPECFQARTIPFHWRDSVLKQLDSKMKKGIIERVPVSETYERCHPNVVVADNDSAEPCFTVDLTALNKFVKSYRPAHPVRPPRDTVAAIPKDTKFLPSLILVLNTGRCLWNNIAQP